VVARIIGMNTASVSLGGDVVLVLQQIQQSCQYGRDANVELTQSVFNAGQALAVYAARGHRPERVMTSISM